MTGWIKLDVLDLRMLSASSDGCLVQIYTQRDLSDSSAPNMGRCSKQTELQDLTLNDAPTVNTSAGG
jgi:hypothetical protein